MVLNQEMKAFSDEANLTPHEWNVLETKWLSNNHWPWYFNDSVYIKLARKRFGFRG